jgi:hypothetical protein
MQPTHLETTRQVESLGRHHGTLLRQRSPLCGTHHGACCPGKRRKHHGEDMFCFLCCDDVGWQNVGRRRRKTTGFPAGSVVCQTAKGEDDEEPSARRKYGASGLRSWERSIPYEVLRAVSLVRGLACTLLGSIIRHSRLTRS